MKAIVYVGLLNEDNVTEYYAQRGEQYRTPWRPAGRPTIMCLATPYREHQIEDIDYILDQLGADGIYFDWMCLMPCTRSHGYHELPVTNIQELIDTIQYVKSKSKLVIIHTGEEGRIPFLTDIADHLVLGERRWSHCDWETTELGIFERWSKTTGKYGVITRGSESRLLECAALAEGLNPFGYGAGAYAGSLMDKLKHYDIESMEFLPHDFGCASTDNPSLRTSILSGREELIAFVINTSDKPSEGKLRFEMERLGKPLAAQYGVYDLGRTVKIAELAGTALMSAGAPLRVPGNRIVMLLITSGPPRTKTERPT
jgi:hypothetical protein